MARPRKSIAVSTGKIGKMKIEERKKQESRLKVDRSGLKPPSWLTLPAAEEFRRVVSECEKIGLLDNLDLGIVAIYCDAYAHYVEASQMLQKCGLLDTRENKHEQYYTVHPLVNVQEKYAKMIMQCSAKLGLATSDRLKLIIPKEEEESTNKYLRYLGG